MYVVALRLRCPRRRSPPRSHERSVHLLIDPLEENSTVRCAAPRSALPSKVVCRLTRSSVFFLRANMHFSTSESDVRVVSAKQNVKFQKTSATVLWSIVDPPNRLKPLKRTFCEHPTKRSSGLSNPTLLSGKDTC